MTKVEAIRSSAAPGCVGVGQLRLTELSISNDSLMNRTMMMIPQEEMRRPINLVFHSRKRPVDEFLCRTRTSSLTWGRQRRIPWS